MTAAETLEKLSAPPIFEVICGVFFDGFPELDPVLIGTYWLERKDEFPGRAIRPAAREPGLHVEQGTPPLRTWLISKEGDGSFVIQIQADRFYLNWRKRGGVYPRFSEANNGVLDRTLGEFSQFSDFCHAAFGRRPEPSVIELSKIDHLVQGEHWSDKGDLGQMLPSLASTLGVTSTSNPSVLLQFQESDDARRLRVGLSTAVVENPEIGQQAVIRFETAVAGAVGDDIRTAFEKANNTANDVFAALIPKEERTKRFDGGGN